MWEFVEKKSGTGTSSLITFRDLDGDTDKFYKIIGRGQAATSAYMRLLLNSVTTDQTAVRWYDSSGTWTRSTTATRLSPTSSADPQMFKIEIFADSTDALDRHWSSLALDSTASPTYALAHGRWADTTTNLTSIRLATSDEDIFFTTESHFWLYKMADPAG